jgi:hypothetical protein
MPIVTAETTLPSGRGSGNSIASWTAVKAQLGGVLLKNPLRSPKVKSSQSTASEAQHFRIVGEVFSVKSWSFSLDYDLIEPLQFDLSDHVAQGPTLHFCQEFSVIPHDVRSNCVIELHSWIVNDENGVSAQI